MSQYLITYRVGLNQENSVIVRAYSVEHVYQLLKTTTIELVRVEALNDQVAA